MEFLSDISARLDRSRIRQGELAEAAGIADSHLSRILRGHVDPTLGTVERIFTALERLEADRRAAMVSPCNCRREETIES